MMGNATASTSEGRWQLFLRHKKSLAAYIRRSVGDRDDAEEVFQELSLIVLRHRSGPSDAEQFSSWCRGLARNALAHHFRAKRRRADLLNKVELEGDDELMGRRVLDPERALSVREALGKVFERVDEKSERLILERYLLGQSAQEIAQRLAQSPTAVRMRLMRLRSAAKRKKS
jgi:RNA polymerase sigma-70 factor (ECF subfamily)